MDSQTVQTLIVFAAIIVAAIYLCGLGVRSMRGKTSCCGTSTCGKKKKPAMPEDATPRA